VDSRHQEQLDEAGGSSTGLHETQPGPSSHSEARRNILVGFSNIFTGPLWGENFWIFLFKMIHSGGAQGSLPPTPPPRRAWTQLGGIKCMHVAYVPFGYLQDATATTHIAQSKPSARSWTRLEVLPANDDDLERASQGQGRKRWTRETGCSVLRCGTGSGRAVWRLSAATADCCWLW